MSEPCGASIAELQRDTGHLHDQADMERAREYLTERLHEGKTVRGRTLRDLIDGDLHGERCEIATQTVSDLLLADSGERAAKADTYIEGVIERFLETNEDFVAETAAELAAERPE